MKSYKTTMALLGLITCIQAHVAPLVVAQIIPSQPPVNNLAFTPNGVDDFESPMLKSIWVPRQWSPVAGAGKRYSLLEKPGSLLLHLETSILLGDYSDAIMRGMPSGDTAIQTTVSYDGTITQGFAPGNRFAGLYIKTVTPNTHGPQYAFGIENGTQLRIQEVGGATLLTRPYSEVSASIRAILIGSNLSFQLHHKGSWMTLLTVPDCHRVDSAGVFLAGNAGSKAAFSEVAVLDPRDHPLSLSQNLRLTEIGVDYYELTNVGTGTLDLTPLRLLTEDAPYALPPGVTLPAGRSVVVTKNLNAFHQTYPGIPAYELPNLTYFGFYIRLATTDTAFFDLGLSGYNFFAFPTPNTAYEIIDPHWNPYDRSNWKTASLPPGAYRPFTPNDNDDFNSPELKSIWQQNSWSVLAGGGKRYSLLEKPGSLLLQVENSIPLEIIWDTMARGMFRKDMAMQTTVAYEGLPTNSFAGLVVQTSNSAGRGGLYTFGISNGDELRVQSVRSGAILATQPYSAPAAGLRVMLLGSELSFQALIDGLWQVLWTNPNCDGVDYGGMFLTGDTDARASFSEFGVTNPSIHPTNVSHNLRLTAVGRDYYEITNVGSGTLDLTNLRVSTEDADYPLPAAITLPAGRSLIMAQNLTAFQQTYGTGILAVSMPDIYYNYYVLYMFVNGWEGIQSGGPHFDFATNSAYEILDPNWKSSDRSNWRRANRLPGNYQPFTPNDNDDFNSPLLKSTWVPFSWSSLAGSAKRFSLTEKPGSLLLHLETPSSIAGLSDTIGRSMPLEDTAIQTTVAYESSPVGSFAGLYIKTGMYSTPIPTEPQYAFGIENGNALRIQEIGGGTVFTQPFFAPAASLRVMLLGSELSFQVLISGSWQVLWTKSSCVAINASGVFLAGAAQTKASFSEVLVVNPLILPTSVSHNLKLAKVGEYYYELINVGTGTLDLTDLRIWNEDDPFALPPGVTLAPGGSLVLAQNLAAFQQTYGTSVPAYSMPNLWYRCNYLRLVINNRLFFDIGLSGYYFFNFNMHRAYEIIDPLGNLYDPSNWRGTTRVPGQWHQDTDNDGMQDFMEAKFGSDPHDANSRNNLSTATNASGQPTLSWSTIIGQTYRVQYCDALGGAWQVLDTLNGNGSYKAFIDTTTPKPVQRFYRIEAP